MLRLPDDCLYEIFCYLDLRQQLAVALSCARFRYIIIDMFWWRKHCQNLSTENPCLTPFNLVEYKTFFQLIAPNLGKLTIDDTKHNSFSTYLGRYMHRPELEFYLSLNLNKLNELNCYDRRMHDGYMQMIVKHCAINLCTLRASSRHITGEHINKLTQLAKLSLPNCSLSADNLCQLLQQCKHLKYLNIIGNPLELQPAHCQNLSSTLETLCIDGNLMCSLDEFLSQLKTLKQLFLVYANCTQPLMIFPLADKVHSLYTNLAIYPQFLENVAQLLNACTRLKYFKFGAIVLKTMKDLQIFMQNFPNINALIEQHPNKPMPEFVADELMLYFMMHQNCLKRIRMMKLEEHGELPDLSDKLFIKFEFYNVATSN